MRWNMPVIPSSFAMALLIAVSVLLSGCGNGGGLRSSVLADAGLEVTGTTNDGAEAGATTPGMLQPSPAAAGNSLLLIVPQEILLPLNATSSIRLLATNGRTPYRFGAEGLPAGYSIDSETGILSGISATPLTTVATFTVVDASGSTRLAASRLTIAPFVDIVHAEELSLTRGKPVRLLFAAPLQGVPPFTFSADNLPRGLNLAINDLKFALLSGTPSLEGSYTVTLTIRDSAGAVATAVSDISVGRQGFWIESAVSFIRLDEAYDQQVCKAQGGDPIIGLTGARMYDYSVSGLPPGIALRETDETPVYGSSQSGTLVTGSATATGTYILTTSATDAAGASVEGIGLIIVTP
ncbi:MAG TPA: putative Ig domain-containing protein [Candidatus Ozemobacteraceae bacterium]|nr:putative Ig domain-containing protein [Candidatus Ozemobacteraceae bacterium]